MVKENVSTSSRETAVKKRRKASAPSELDTEVDIYKKVIGFEEKEALNRSDAADANLYFETCKNIRGLLDEIFELKKRPSVENRAKVAEKYSQACVFIAVLKKLNRLEKFRATAARDLLTEEKQKVDNTNLQYQNLLYEAAHLISEFTKCKQFKSKDEDIELISIDEFLSEAPTSVTKPFKNQDHLSDTEKHELHLARLEWELTQRKQLAELCNTFDDEKKQLGTEIIALKNRLDGLVPRLEAVLEATKPLQEHLGLPIDKVQAEHKLASLLPNSLYLLYANSDAYKQVYGLDMIVEILGDPDEAAQWKQLQKTVISQGEESEPETETQEVEEIVEVKKRRHRKASHVDRAEEKKKRALEAHPLSVQVTVHIKNGPTLKMQFYYRIQLDIITVHSVVDVPSSLSGHAIKEVLSGESLLGELFEQDHGTESPNPGNHYLLRKFDFHTFHSLVPKIGYAYLWAQKMCGLDFLSTQTQKEDNKISQTNVEKVMKTLYKRLKYRSALASQLQQLEQNLIPAVPNNVEMPKNSISTLTKWVSVSWQQYCQSRSTSALVESEIVSPTDMFYCATISRPKGAYLQAYICIKNDYPHKCPIFSLTVKYEGEHYSANCDDIRDMERSINLGWSENAASATWLLAAQLRYLCSYFDVYLETLTSSGFVQNTFFFKNISGRNRRRPFKFLKLGTGIFVQY